MAKHQQKPAQQYGIEVKISGKKRWAENADGEKAIFSTEQAATEYIGQCCIDGELVCNLPNVEFGVVPMEK